jgi:hypothetical protein
LLRNQGQPTLSESKALDLELAFDIRIPKTSMALHCNSCILILLIQPNNVSQGPAPDPRGQSLVASLYAGTAGALLVRKDQVGAKREFHETKGCCHDKEKWLFVADQAFILCWDAL